MNDKRPVYLDLTTIKQPIPAKLSILHRIAGLLIFLGLPLFLWVLDRSLASPESFAELQSILAHPLARLLTWGLLAAILYHLVAGIRHMLMDMDIGFGPGINLDSGLFSAKVVFLVSAILIVLAGCWLWW